MLFYGFTRARAKAPTTLATLATRRRRRATDKPERSRSRARTIFILRLSYGLSFRRFRKPYDSHDGRARPACRATASHRVPQGDEPQVQPRSCVAGRQRTALQGDSQTIISYGITRPVDTLNRSLELLYENYVNKFPTDVIIFHDSVTGPSNVTRTQLSAAYPNLEFRCLRKRDWSLPHGLKAWQHMFWNRPQFSVGYRLMMRWYAVLIWFYLSEEGYTHVMRMDDDSYITSQIRYNLFGFMRQNNKRYAFRQPTVDDGVGRGYNELIDKFLDDHPNVTPPAQIELTKKE
ncbi:hypothetical protein THAOC_25934, partial [Thalassiosira oceanica]